MRTVAADDRTLNCQVRFLWAEVLNGTVPCLEDGLAALDEIELHLQLSHAVSWTFYQILQLERKSKEKLITSIQNGLHIQIESIYISDN